MLLRYENFDEKQYSWFLTHGIVNNHLLFQFSTLDCLLTLPFGFSLWFDIRKVSRLYKQKCTQLHTPPFSLAMGNKAISISNHFNHLELSPKQMKELFVVRLYFRLLSPYNSNHGGFDHLYNFSVKKLWLRPKNFHTNWYKIFWSQFLSI